MVSGVSGKKGDGFVRWKIGNLAEASKIQFSSVGGEFSLFLLYLGNPFYFYPHKALMCFIFGAEYLRAYRHFRSAHSKPLNIAVNLMCLIYSMLANCALLRSIDSMISSDQ